MNEFLLDTFSTDKCRLGMFTIMFKKFTIQIQTTLQLTNTVEI